jgi:hypothetical protein
LHVTFDQAQQLVASYREYLSRVEELRSQTQTSFDTLRRVQQARGRGAVACYLFKGGCMAASCRAAGAALFAPARLPCACPSPQALNHKLLHLDGGLRCGVLLAVLLGLACSVRMAGSGCSWPWFC